ncbi:hypothetical protein SDC9_111376 [bioreactor metagenome]|uniref:Lipoprotein n=1 Tax=bioreactor metagenome TaxID=1076179 RepID=A0A645BGC2_9ZZZZ
MKKLILLFMTVALFASCDKKTPKLLNPDATINIREAKQTRSAGQDTPTWEWVVRNAGGMIFKNTDMDMPMGYFTRGIGDHQRDFENMAIKMFGTDIITQFGELSLDFIGASDVVFVAIGDDTCAYIPNVTLREAEVKVIAAYNAGNYDEVYRLFDNAYRAVPTTGKAYRALKAEGKE